MLELTRRFIGNQWRLIANSHPLARGMASYAVLWPTASLIQQKIEGKDFSSIDWKRCLRFSLFGGLFAAPTLFCWLRVSNSMWPKRGFRSGLTKAIVDQISYAPFFNASFYFGMSLLESKTVKQATQEVQNKFWPTVKVGICVWPFLQTINYALVPERNSLIFVSSCSLLWIVFLASMNKRKMADNADMLPQLSNLMQPHSK